MKRPAPGIPLPKLLQAHHSLQKGSKLPRSLGDGWLNRRNPVFRSVRRSALRSGCRFSRSDADVYLACRWLSLPQILKTGCIPYLDNVRALERIDRLNPGEFTSQELFGKNFAEANHVFHESCHCIAAAVIRSLRLDRDAQEPQARALVILLGEAFANASELLLWLHADSALHGAFVETQVYIKPQPDQLKALRSLVTFASPKDAHRMLIFLYLLSNLNVGKVSQKQLKVILIAFLGGLGADPRVLRPAALLLKTALELNPVFRFYTTQMYFRAVGLRLRPEQLVPERLLAIFVDEPRWVQALDSMASAASSASS
jgi:hypothetical protein